MDYAIIQLVSYLKGGREIRRSSSLCKYITRTFVMKYLYIFFIIIFSLCTSPVNAEYSKEVKKITAGIPSSFPPYYKSDSMNEIDIVSGFAADCTNIIMKDAG